MIGFDQAIELVRSVARPLGIETVLLANAAGRVLARPVIAQIDSPRSDVSAMDGYAVREADLEQFPVALEIVGQSFAGLAWNGSVAPGTCARIFTGAPVPTGSDRVVVQENVDRQGELALIAAAPGPARHVRKRGSDFAQGEELLAPERLLDPRAIVAAAAADVGQVEVYRRPRLQILSTGDELAEPGTARDQTGAIPESLSFAIAALGRQWGADFVGRMRLRDELRAMEQAASDSLEQGDVVVVTGGASVGEKDFAKAMFEPFGLELIFSKVSIKPGKPVWLGRVGEKLVVGLPGNPTSALVTGRLFLAPLLAGLTGQPIERALRWRWMPLASPLKECGQRETFHRARSAKGAAEILLVEDSAAQKALAEADLLVRQQAHAPALDADSPVAVLDF